MFVLKAKGEITAGSRGDSVPVHQGTNQQSETQDSLKSHHAVRVCCSSNICFIIYGETFEFSDVTNVQRQPERHPHHKHTHWHTQTHTSLCVSSCRPDLLAGEESKPANIFIFWVSEYRGSGSWTCLGAAPRLGAFGARLNPVSVRGDVLSSFSGFLFVWHPDRPLLDPGGTRIKRTDLIRDDISLLFSQFAANPPHLLCFPNPVPLVGGPRQPPVAW